MGGGLGFRICCLRLRGWGTSGCFGVGCGQVFRGERFRTAVKHAQDVQVGVQIPEEQHMVLPYPRVPPRLSLIGLHNEIGGEPKGLGKII